MSWLTVFGSLAVATMAIFYALERRGAVFTLAFAIACAAASAYGFLARTWPFGIIEALWALLALYRWHQRLETEA